MVIPFINLILGLFFILHCSCHTYTYKGWNEAGDYLSKSVNTSVDPCENFYSFVCGNWKAEYANATKSESEFEKLEKQLAKIIQSSIENIEMENPTKEPFKKSLKIFYQQCDNHSKNRDIFFEDMYEHLQNYFMPIISENGTSDEALPWNGHNHGKFWKLVGTMQRELGLSFLFESEILPGETECQTKPILHLRPFHAFQKKIVQERDMEILFRDIINKFHNTTLDPLDINDTMKAAIEFESDLDDLIARTTNLMYVYHHPTRQYRLTYDQLIREIPSIDWSEYFDGLLPDSIKQRWLDSNPTIMLDSGLEFFRNVSSLIQNHGLVVSSNFGFILALQKYFWFFTKSMPKTLDRKQLLDVPIFGKNVCLDLSVRYFSSASLRLLLDNLGYDLDEWKSDMVRLKDTTFAAFRFLIAGTQWLDAEEKARFVDRVNQVGFYGDIPDWIMNNDVVEAKTPKYNSSLSLIANDILAQKALFEQQLKPLITGQMDDLPPSFVHNAFNLFRGKGNIRFLFGWQLPPGYTYLYPLAVKYGGIGTIMAHELMHSFGTHVYVKPKSELEKLAAVDPYDLRNVTLEEFEKRCQCLVPHFEAYCLEEKYSCPIPNYLCEINATCTIGERTLEENVADTEAIKVAYNAFKFAQKTTGIEPPIPNMVDYTEDQIFFIAFARQYCTTENRRDYRNMFITHSAYRARVEQSLINFSKFSQTFGCSKSSRFGGRDKKCVIYGSI